MLSNVMKKILLFFLFATVAKGQDFKIFLPDSSDFVVYQAFQDSLEIEFSAEKNKVEFAEFVKQFGKYHDNDFQYKRFADITIDALEMELFDQRLAQSKFLEKSNFSSLLKTYLSNEVNNQYWALIYAYPIIRGNADTKIKRVVSVPAAITKDFNESVLKSNTALKSKAIRKLIPFWVTYRNSEKHNFEKYSNYLISVNDKTEFSLENLKGLVLDFSLAQILNTNKNALSSSAAKYVISQIENDEIRDKFTGDFLNDVIANNEKAIAKNKKREADSKETMKFTDLEGNTFGLSEFKGKVVYLDFWASWCGPCRMQFPHSKTLHEAIPKKYRKDIVFLYISIDDTVEKWKEGIQKNGLEEFTNGFTEGAWDSPLLQKLGVRSIPRYMIIDKEGKIVDANAKRPSNPEILPELLKLVE